MAQLAAAGITLSRAKFYELIGSGTIPTVTLPGVARRLYIRSDALASWIS